MKSLERRRTGYEFMREIQDSKWDFTGKIKAATMRGGYRGCMEMLRRFFRNGEMSEKEFTQFFPTLHFGYEYFRKHVEKKGPSEKLPIKFRKYLTDKKGKALYVCPHGRWRYGEILTADHFK